MISLPQEILFHAVTGHSDLSRCSICAFADVYSPLNQVSKPLKETIDRCWKLCLERLWDSWKGSIDLSKEEFVKKLFPRSRFVVNWIDGTPKITKKTYEEIPNKELVLRYEEPIQGCVYKINGAGYSFLFSEAIVENVCFDSYYFGCGHELAVKVNTGHYGSISFYRLANMELIGTLDGNCQKRVMSDGELKPLFFPNAVGVFSADINLQQNKFSRFALDIYDCCLTKIREIELPFHPISAHATNDRIVFYSRQDRHYILAATSYSSDRSAFVYSESFSQSHRASKLVDVQGQLFLVSTLDKGISIQAVELQSDRIDLKEVNIFGFEGIKFNLLILNAYSHLDKLFVITYDADYYPSLYAIDFASKKMQKISSVEFKWLNHEISVTSSSLGMVKFFIADRYKPEVMTLDYD